MDNKEFKEYLIEKFAKDILPYVNKEKIWTEEEKNNRINSFAKLFTNEQRDESLSVVLSLIDFILSEKVNFEKRQKAHNIIKVFLLNTDNEKSLITFWIKILEYPESKEQTEILNLIENYKPELWNKIINLLEEENNSTNKAKNETGLSIGRLAIAFALVEPDYFNKIKEINDRAKEFMDKHNIKGSFKSFMNNYRKFKKELKETDSTSSEKDRKRVEGKIKDVLSFIKDYYPDSFENAKMELEKIE